MSLLLRLLDVGDKCVNWVLWKTRRDLPWMFLRLQPEIYQPDRLVPFFTIHIDALRSGSSVKKEEGKMKDEHSLSRKSDL